MKHLMENWRRHLNEVTTVPPEHMQAFKDTITSSKFWDLPHTEDDVDLGSADELTTDAAQALMDALNETAERLGTEIYFLFTVTDEAEYALGPDSPYPGYPDNWLMRGAYQGPQQGKHVVWFQFRPLGEDFEMDRLNPTALVKVLSQTLNHELVHYYQLKKQAANKGISDEEAWAELEKDPKQLPQDSAEQTYLGLHNEIDAYAHEAAEQLLDKHSPEEALGIIRKLSADNLDQYPEISSVIEKYMKAFKDDPKTLDKFRKKLVSQIEKQAGMQEIFNNWRTFLTEGGGRTLYYIGKGPAKPQPATGLSGGPEGWERSQHDEPVGSGVFLSPNPVGIYHNHAVTGNVYAYDVSHSAIKKAGGLQRYDWGTEVLFPEDVWSEAEAAGEIKFLGKSMDKDEFEKKADASPASAGRTNVRKVAELKQRIKT